MELPESMYRGNRPGFMDSSFCSCTPIREVAINYSGVRAGKPLPALFEIIVGSSDRPGFIPSCCYQYPNEVTELREIIWLPGTFVEPIGAARLEYTEHGVVTLYPIRVTNSKFLTVEQIKGQRKKMHIGNCLYNISILEFRLHRLSSPSLRHLLAVVLEKLKSKTDDQARESEDVFNCDETYRVLVFEMLELHSTVNRAFSLVAPAQ
jgi:hypothetical protein